ncbi:Por secretion system C-terminal sorting domain-containing protein [Reichenbachiella agariperforans]|uniref:Por secretion system C-terminal sorting domain-containing protein n=1 Tax=Reichenbachiella agariperforans TaxID=156994 RepID=A0A1M6RSI3_REIAG|nr:chondroitinase-B domain-containing protein [Reichenbachiella agariperforans]SHK35298.1 Por secretion system C-terminal sorting domain-containing protein [Reichenbachiella agariperforans]
MNKNKLWKTELNSVKKLCATIGFVIYCTSTFGQNVTTVSDIDELKDIINAASPGDTIQIADGTYDGNGMTINVQGTDIADITVRAESTGGVVFTGDTKFVLRTCAYLTIQGITFTNSGTAIKLEGSNNIRITRNIFRLTEESSTKWVYIGGVWDQPTSSFSHHNRIDHNLFENKVEVGHYITIDGSGETVQSQFDVIDHNHFRNNTPRATNEKESIRVGWSEMSESSGFTTVEFNLFEECNGDPEIVSLKSCDNIVRHNTFLKSEGTLSLRHGNRNRVEGNYFLGGGAACSVTAEGIYCTGGIRVYGEDHVIVNNYFEGLKGQKWDAPITLTEGDAESGNGSLSKHFRIERALIAYNTLVNNDYGIEIGFDNNGKYSKPPRDVTMAYNIVTGSTNDLIYYHNEPDNMVWVNNIMQPTGTAMLTSDERTFESTEVSVENPFLSYDDETGTWRSTDQTPVALRASTILDELAEDIEGHSRPETSTVGADHYSLESVRYAPLTSEDVGPHSFHPDYDGESEVDYLLVSTNEISTGTNATVSSLDINTNLEWTVSTDATWVSLDVTSGTGSGSVSVSVTANTDYMPRTATIQVSGSGFSRDITVVQAAAVLNLGGEKLNIVAVMASAEQDGNGKENAIDGDMDTRWSAEGEQHLTLELDGVHEVSYVKIAFLNGDERTTTYKVDLSEDNTTFVNLVAKTESAGFTEDFETIDFEDTIAKYIKLTGFGNSSSDWNSISEIEVWGEANGSQATLSTKAQNRSDIVLYPNPVQSTIHLKGLMVHYQAYTLLDMTGRVLEHGELQGNVIDVSGVSWSGMVMLKISGLHAKPLSFTVIKQ